jgi:hypothetical protein
MNAYFTRRINAYLKKRMPALFPQPVELTVEARNDLNIHTLREVNVRVNGKTVGVCLNYCACAAPGQEYSVSGYNLDEKGHFAEFFPTQDEAEAEYIVRASHVGQCLHAAMIGLDAEVHTLFHKINGNGVVALDDTPITPEHLAAWIPEAPMTRPA